MPPLPDRHRPPEPGPARSVGRASAAPRTARLRRALAAALLAALPGLAVPATGGGATPGALTAQSIRGEPLRAVIALGTERDGPAPALRVAPRTTYARLGHERDAALDHAALRVAPQPDGLRFLEVSTAGPIDADELVLVIESTDGSLRRLYRVRLGTREPADRVNVRGLDVPDRTAAPTGAASDSPSRVSGVGVRGVATASAPSPAQVVAAPRRPPAITILEDVDLETLADEFRPADASLEQAAIAFWRLNRRGLPGRPPRPAVGTRLIVPTEDEMRAIDPGEARRFMAALARPAPPAPPAPPAAAARPANPAR